MEKNTYSSNLSLDEKVLMGIVRAAEIFKRSHSNIFGNFGLSFPQYNILRVLEGSENGQSRISNVSKIMLVPNANMTGIAKRLEKNGFLIRKPDPSDERATILEITPKGRQALKNAEKEKDRWLEVTLDGFSQEEKRIMLDYIKRLISNEN